MYHFNNVTKLSIRILKYLIHSLTTISTIALPTINS